MSAPNPNLNINNLSEFIVLFKAFYKVKFDSDVEDEDIGMLVRSPYFSKMFNEALKGMISQSIIYNSNASIQDYHIDKWPIERSIIKKHLLSVDNWHELTIDTKKEIVEIIFSPYLFDDVTRNQLLNEIDLEHTSKLP